MLIVFRLFEKLIEYCRKREYPEKALREHYKFTQDQLLEVILKKPLNTPVMVTNYNPNNPNFKDIINKNWNMLSNSPDYGHLFKDKPLVGFRRLPDFRDMLTKVSIRYPSPVSIQPSLTPPICTRLGKCTYCPLIKKIKSVQCNFTKKPFQLNDLPKHITCELSNVIYLIS